MSEPLRLIPMPERAAAENRGRMLRHLDHYRELAEKGEIDQLGIVATFTDGGASTSSVELNGKRVLLIGAMTTWLHRVVAGYLSDD